MRTAPARRVEPLALRLMFAGEVSQLEPGYRIAQSHSNADTPFAIGHRRYACTVRRRTSVRIVV
jgi:hypothetical protein